MKQSSLHVGIIMDGNGRWSHERGLPRVMGHQAGAEALREVVETAPSCGIGILTAYAFSSDNWKRPEEEVAALMTLLAAYLEQEAPEFLFRGVRVSVIGRRDRLPARLCEAIRTVEKETENARRFQLRLAIDYSGRDAIVSAAERARESPLPRPLERESFGHLIGNGPPVDLLIRTGGEQRLSDFLLWECAYAELLFTKCMWPDFRGVDLRNAVVGFHRRIRRFGGLVKAPELATAGTQRTGGERWLR